MKVILKNSSLVFTSVKDATIKTYLKTTVNNQYINLSGISSIVSIPHNQIKIETDFVLTGTDSYSSILTTRNGSVMNDYGYASGYAGKVRCGYSGADELSVVTGVQGTEYVCVYDGANGKSTINGSLEKSFTATPSSVTAIALFAYCGNTAADINGSGTAGLIKLKGVKITDQSTGNVIFNGSPALDGDDVACLYDSVNRTCYYANSGSLAVE